MLVVLDVVLLRRVSERGALSEAEDAKHLAGGAVRDPDGQVREHSERLVRADALEREVVRDLVDRAADDIRQCNERPPVPPAHGVREAELERDDTRDDELGARLVAHQARDLGVHGGDRAPARAVRLLHVQPEEVRRVLRWVYMLVDRPYNASALVCASGRTSSASVARKPGPLIRACARSTVDYTNTARSN
jgi:hypothetical protein